MEHFSRRAGSLAAFVLFSACLFPLWTPAQPQTRLEYQVAEHSKQLETLQQMPGHVALIEQRQGQMESRQIEDSKAIADIKTAAFTGVTGILIFLATQLVSYFGAKRRA